jgi:hypothetical protein
MKKTILICGIILIFSGCICCTGTELGNLTPNKEGEINGCPPPYIEYGNGCCLDLDGDGICDNQEIENEPEKEEMEEEPEIQAIQTTTTLQTTTLPATTTTQPKAKASTYECVKSAGYNPDNIIYGYSGNCGNKFISTASSVSIQKGVKIDAINIGGFIDEKKIAMMECFYGKYSDSNPSFKQCPVLLCPLTGEVKILSSVGNVKSQMEGFALNCRQDAN